MGKGRDVPALPTFTFKDSGVTVRYRRLSPFTLNQLNAAIRKEKKAPEPPLNEVDYGNGKKVNEPNLADPAYEQALREYEGWVEQEGTTRMTDMIMTYALEPIEIDTEALARYRAFAERFHLECESDDNEIYLRYIAVGSPEDLADVSTLVMRRSEPTPEAIQEAVTTFPGDVPGA